MFNLKIVTMNLETLNDRLYFQKTGYGTWKVYYVCRNFFRCGITHNSLAVDRIGEELSARSSRYGYTLKQAYLALFSCVTDVRYSGKPFKR